MASETLRFNIFADDNGSRVFDKFGKTVGDTESKLHKVGRGLVTVGKMAAVGLAAGVGVGAVAMKRFVGDARESERVTKLTEAVIKSTGGAAKVSAAQVAALSTSISNKTGVDDEAIQTGSNLLLTFKNVRNEVGKGNAVFDRATQSAVDLSAAGFGSIDSASKMLGKALNDPIAGITALGRAGVTFTAQQKEQIKAMVESGNVLGAQKLIMKEVESQVGGAAAATGTATDKLKVTLGNLSEQIGAKLLPYIDKAASGIGTFIGQMQSGEGPGGRFAEMLRNVGNFIMTNVVPAIQSIAGWLQANLVPALQKVGADLLPKLQNMFASVSKTIKDHEGTFKALGLIITGVIIPVVGRVAGILIDVLGPALRGVMTIIRDVLIPIWATLVSVVLGAAGIIVNGAAKAFGWIPGLGGKLKGAAKAFNDFRDEVQGSLNQIVAAARGTGENFAAGVAAGIRASTGLAVGAAGDMANKVAAQARHDFQEQSPSKVGIEIGRFFSEGVSAGIKDKTAVATEAVSDLATKVKDKLAGLRSDARSILDGIKSAMSGAFDWSGIGATTTTPGGTDAEGNALPDVSTTASPVQQFADFASTSRAFASAISQAVAKGLNPTAIAKVANLGPTQGLVAAQALANLDPASIASVNRDHSLADKFAAKVATTVLSTTGLPEDIARQEGMLSTLKAIRQDLAKDRDIRIVVNDATDPDAVVAAIRRYIKKNGLLRNVTA